MLEQYGIYLDLSDPLLDEPSVRVIERILTGYARMQRERDDFCKELATQLRPDQLTEDRWKRQLSTVAEFVPHGAEGALARAS
jgi:hypothetical protein